MSNRGQQLPTNVYFESERDGLGATVSMWGTTDLPNPDDAPEELILIIPGNPGLVNFYYDYACNLHTMTKMPVWTIGHAGHSDGDPLQSRKNAYNVDKQLRHKIDFLEKHTSPCSKVHLVGHSLGGWMSTELLQNSQLKERIASATLLFPTLEHIAQTPNGRWLNIAVRNMTSVVLLSVYIFTLLPQFFSKILVYLYFLIVGYPYEYIPHVYFFLRVPAIRRCLQLAYSEMDVIKDLNVAALSENTHRVKVLFNDNDGWAPGDTFRKLRHTIPDLHIQQTSARHAYVMGHSRHIADVTSTFILNY